VCSGITTGSLEQRPTRTYAKSDQENPRLKEKTGKGQKGNGFQRQGNKGECGKEQRIQVKRNEYSAG
jgi:hypothetical protein